MTARALSVAALCCAVALLTGCTKPAARKAVKSKSVAEAASDSEDAGPMESYPADAKFDPSARLFLYGSGLPTAIHAEYVEDFLRHPGAGFGRIGFAPPPAPSPVWTELVLVSPGERRLSVAPAGNEGPWYDAATGLLTPGDGSRRERRERVWLLQDRRLVSAAKQVVYLSAPRKQHELQAQPTGASASNRPLNAFEKEALKRLRAGDEVALQSDDRELRMLGAIRARQDCVSCHDGGVGTLIAAFTYTLKPQCEETPESFRLADHSGLTERQVGAVRSIEAIGGKLIRARNGSVSEALMTFSRTLEHAGGTPWSGAPSTRIKLRDEAVQHLAAFPDLTAVDVSDSFISDAGLKTLAELKNLKKLDLRDTRVTAEGVAAMRKALPECKILTSLSVPPP